MALLALHGSRIAAALAVGLAFGGIALAASPDEQMDMRETAMKKAGGALKALSGDAKAGTVSAGAAAKAKDLVDLGAGLEALFPEGPQAEKSRALPAIWTDKAGFSAKAKDLQTAAAAVSAAVTAGDAKALAAAIDQAGAACGACHKAFRGPEKD
jgi:cytochrome c556